VDEAYVEFSPHSSAVKLIDAYDHVIVLRTLSKAMGLAGVRCGGMIAHEDVIQQAIKVLAVYPVPVPVLNVVMQALAPANRARLKAKREEIVETRNWMMQRLATMEAVDKVFPSDTNFIFVRFKDGAAIDALARKHGFIMRYQGNVPRLENGIRFSMGTRAEMESLAELIEKGKLPERTVGRKGASSRKTKETAIDVHVDLDALAPVAIATGVGFFDHMLDQIARHAGISLVVDAQGDTHIDPHHVVEDTAIALGEAFYKALGDKNGIERYGFTLPMDESIAQITIDLSGRGLLVFKGAFCAEKVGEMPTSLVEHFFRSLAENMRATIHLSVEGQDAHHQIEACFKAFARALRQAISKGEGSALPSTKGIL
jgi:histidinol-phosphate aminotransferase/imidazoleglycerol-phosphate dehydratase/histidinol-phosphatase